MNNSLKVYAIPNIADVKIANINKNKFELKVTAKEKGVCCIVAEQKNKIEILCDVKIEYDITNLEHRECERVVREFKLKHRLLKILHTNNEGYFIVPQII